MTGLIIFATWIFIGLLVVGIVNKGAEGTNIKITQRDMAVWTMVWPYVLFVLFFRPMAEA